MANESILISEVIPGAPMRIFNAWLDSTEHSAFTGRQASIEPGLGGAHSAFDGYIQGRILELQDGSRIVQSWRTSEFPADSPDSRLEITLEPTLNGTLVTLLHTDIPSGQSDRYRSGWNDLYLSRLKSYFSEAAPVEVEVDPEAPMPTQREPEQPGPTKRGATKRASTKRAPTKRASTKRGSTKRGPAKRASTKRGPAKRASTKRGLKNLAKRATPKSRKAPAKFRKVAKTSKRAPKASAPKASAPKTKKAARKIPKRIPKGITKKKAGTPSSKRRASRPQRRK